MRKQLLTAAAMVRRSATGMATTTAWGGRRRRPAVCLPGGRRSGRYVGHMTEAPEDFEYERRFFVRDLPRAILGEEPPAVIVQTYFLAQDGYGLRLRLQASAPRQRLDPASRADDALAQFAGEFDLCVLTAKGPYVGGTRYEAERELDIGMGIEMSKRGGATIAKSRYSVWLDEDGWVIDEFAGANRPLIIAECERGGPVVDLRIPSFCVTEVTEDPRFSNDALVNASYSAWAYRFEEELATTGPRFATDFGTNRQSLG